MADKPAFPKLPMAKPSAPKPFPKLPVIQPSRPRPSFPKLPIARPQRQPTSAFPKPPAPKPPAPKVSPFQRFKNRRDEAKAGRTGKPRRHLQVPRVRLRTSTVLDFIKRIPPRASIEPPSFVKRCGQFLAAFLLPFLFVVGMGFATTIFQMMMGLIGANGLNIPVLWLIQPIVGTGLLIALFIASFKWVESAGFGLLVPRITVVRK